VERQQLVAAPAAPRSFFAPFGDADFFWVFVSRLLYQMGVYSVQEYLFYYVKFAVVLPADLDPHDALSLTMLPLLLAAVAAPLVAGWVSDRYVVVGCDAAARAGAGNQRSSSRAHSWPS
jgi:hypothetical protein